MAEEREGQSHEPKPSDRLEDWREAERDVEAEEPHSAGRKMARNRADVARDDFHDSEDQERHDQGDDRPRHLSGESSP